MTRDYYIEKNQIKLTQISLIEKLSEERLFILLQVNQEISNNYLWGKIIDKNEKNEIIRVMDKYKNLLTIEKYNNNIKLGQYFIFTDFITSNNKIILKEDDSFCYYSSKNYIFLIKYD